MPKPPTCIGLVTVPSADAKPPDESPRPADEAIGGEQLPATWPWNIGATSAVVCTGWVRRTGGRAGGRAGPEEPKEAVRRPTARETGSSVRGRRQGEEPGEAPGVVPEG